jgi:antibiotic biosynthesis monooxygenase (ABM) superfamily enzyme
MASNKQLVEPVTAIFSWTVRPGKEREFQSAMHHVHEGAKTFPGHMGVTTFQSPKSRGVYYTVLRFDTSEHMHAWINSSARKDLVEEVYKTATLDTDFEATGLETWFDLPGQSVAPPPRWKMVTTTFVAIYPLSLLFNLYVAPHLIHWPVVLRAVVFSIIAPVLLTYLLMPFLTQRIFKHWLYKS